VRRLSRACELGNDPAVGELVVQDDRVAFTVVQADAAEAGPQRLDADRPEDGGAGRLVEDLEPCVDDLDVLGRPDLVSGGAQLQLTPGNAIPSKLSPGLGMFEAESLL
jgi:hypothetical protein